MNRNYTIPRLTKFKGSLESNYIVDGVVYEYPSVGKHEPGVWYVWFKGGRLDIVSPEEYGLTPGNQIIINKIQYTLDSVMIVRSKKGIITVI